MTPTRKRRCFVAIIAVGIVAAVVGFAVFREDSKDGGPRLVVFGEQQVNGQDAVIFQFDAPKHRAAVLGTVRTHSPSTGREREAVCDAVPGQLVAAGESALLTVIIPTDHVWRVRCEIWSVDSNSIAVGDGRRRVT